MKRFIGLLILFAGVANAAIPQSERDALIALYNSTNGDSWTTKTNWKSAGIFSAAGTEVVSSLLCKHRFSGCLVLARYPEYFPV